jgi:translation initiation factor eIF-2B subunit epsilon
VPAYTRVSLCQQLVKQASLSDDELEYAAAGGKAQVQQDKQSAVSGHQESDGDSEFDNDSDGAPGEYPSKIISAAAAALSQGRVPETNVGFDTPAVGQNGAGFVWAAHDLDPADVPMYSIAAPLRMLPVAEDSDSGDSVNQESVQDQPNSAVDDPDAVFKREVNETFLKSVQMDANTKDDEEYDQNLAAIELNSLKLAENRTFADVARYLFTCLLSLCLPAPVRTREEYRDLYEKNTPDTATSAGRQELLSRLQARLTKWKDLLMRFVKSEEEQVELLLTLEEYCEEEGGFENEHGHQFEAVFVLVLKLLYDLDIVVEDAILSWADEKDLAEEQERKYLQKASQFVTWLREAEDEESSEEGGDSDGSESK